MPDPIQIDFFASLDFPGRQMLYPGELALKLGVTVDHILDLAEEGEFAAVDLRGKNASRRLLRIPVESYREFILRRMTGPGHREFLRTLPKATLREMLHKQVTEDVTHSFTRFLDTLNPAQANAAHTEREQATQVERLRQLADSFSVLDEQIRVLTPR